MPLQASQQVSGCIYQSGRSRGDNHQLVLRGAQIVDGSRQLSRFEHAEQPAVLIDGEAGLEQINRQVVSRLHTLLIVSDPTSRGLETAALIRKMVKVDKVMECKKLGLVLNRVRGSEQLLTEAARKLDLDLFGMIPFDETIAEQLRRFERRKNDPLRQWKLIGSFVNYRTDIGPKSPKKALISAAVKDSCCHSLEL